MENSKNFVFIINGHNGAGKDEFVHQFKQACANHGAHYAVSNISTIDPIKEMITIPNLWDGKTKDDAARQLMHDIKDAVDKYNGYTTKYVVNKTAQFMEDILSDPVVCQHKDAIEDDNKIRTVTFIHCREPEKISSILNAFINSELEVSVDTILVRRDSNEIASNSADQNVENFLYDMYIHNDGTLSDLYTCALALKAECDFYSGVKDASPYISDPNYYEP